MTSLGDAGDIEMDDGRNIMQLVLAGTIVRGAIHTDRPVELPDDSLVTIVLKSREADSSSDEETVWLSFLNRCRTSPSQVGRGYRNREELYDRG